VFELAGFGNDRKMKWAAAHIRGRAKLWLSNCNMSLCLMNWQQFYELLLDRFPDSRAHKSMDQFQQLKQHTTLNAYIDAFEEWMTLVKRDRTYLPEYFFTLRFLSGLKETIKHAVKAHKPLDLRAAYWYSIQEELAYLSTNKKQPNITVTPSAQPAQPLPRQVFNRETRNRPPPEKPKEKGKC
jgi:hypothetical protein